MHYVTRYQDNRCHGNQEKYVLCEIKSKVILVVRGIFVYISLSPLSIHMWYSFSIKLTMCVPQTGFWAPNIPSLTNFNGMTQVKTAALVHAMWCRTKKKQASAWLSFGYAAHFVHLGVTRSDAFPWYPCISMFSNRLLHPLCSRDSTMEIRHTSA